jgi:hypothetical protein
MEKEVADDVGLATHEEGERGRHEVPDEDLVVVERVRALRILRGHRPDRVAAVAYDGPPQQPPRLSLGVRILPHGRGRSRLFIGPRRRRGVILLRGRGLEGERVRKEDAVEEGEVAGDGGARVGRRDGTGDGGGGCGWAGLRGGGGEEGEAAAVGVVVRVGASREERVRGCGVGEEVAAARPHGCGCCGGEPHRGLTIHFPGEGHRRGLRKVAGGSA